MIIIVLIVTLYPSLGLHPLLSLFHFHLELGPHNAFSYLLVVLVRNLAAEHRHHYYQYQRDAYY